MDVPEALTPFASGAEVSRTTAGGRQRLVTRLEQPMQFAVVTAGKYKVIEETQDDVTCRARCRGCRAEARSYSLSTILIMSCWLPSGSVPYPGMV